MFLSMTTWVTGVGEAVGGVAMEPHLVTAIMAVVAATLALGAVLIAWDWFEGWITKRRAPRKRRTGSVLRTVHRAHGGVRG